MKNKNARRFFALVLSLLLTVAAVPMTVAATDAAYKDGELLLKMTSLDENSVLVNKYSNSVKNTPNAKAKRDAADTTKILANHNDTYGGIGVNTDLPLNSDTAYTIEYYAKLTDASDGMGLFFGFCHNKDYPYYGADFYTTAAGTAVHTHSKWWNNGWYKEGSSTDRGSTSLGSNVWTNKADDDGFVQFVMTFDGQYMTLSVGGTPIGTRYDMSRPGTADFKSVSNWELKTLCLEAGFTAVGNSSATKPSTGDCIVELKDISVFSGVVNPDDIPDPEFVVLKDTSGKVLSSTLIENGSHKIDSFPTIQGASNVIWLNEETGAIVEAPVTFTNNATLRAYSFGVNDSKTLDIQYGNAANGKQNIRFIAGVYSMDGSGVGFDVTVRYMKDGVLVEELYRGMGNTVYDCVKATEGGTFKNFGAKEKGTVYLYGMELENVPTDIGQIDFTVKSFKQVGKSKLRIYDEAVTVSFKNGVIDSTLTPLS